MLGDAKQLVRLVVGNDTLLATQEHPFYAQQEWIAAKDLRKGVSILLLSGLIGTMEHVTLLDTLVATYNFEVAQTHNYFVGLQGTLVHNTCATSGGCKATQLQSAAFDGKVVMDQKALDIINDIFKEQVGMDATALYNILEDMCKELNQRQNRNYRDKAKPKIDAFVQRFDMNDGNSDLYIIADNQLSPNQKMALMKKNVDIALFPQLSNYWNQIPQSWHNLPIKERVKRYEIFVKGASHPPFLTAFNKPEGRDLFEKAIGLNFPENSIATFLTKVDVITPDTKKADFLAKFNDASTTYDGFRDAIKADVKIVDVWNNIQSPHLLPYATNRLFLKAILDEIDDWALVHIFKGHTYPGFRIKGVHHKIALDPQVPGSNTVGDLRTTGTNIYLNGSTGSTANGHYKAQVQICNFAGDPHAIPPIPATWINKVDDNGVALLSTFFDDNWTRARIIEEIAYAKAIGDKRYLPRDVTKAEMSTAGIWLRIVLDTNGKLITAFID